MKQFYLFLAALCTLDASAQTFSSDVNAPVPDDGGVYTWTIEVSGLPSAIDLSYGLERVCVNMDHTWDSDVQMWLLAPDGTQVELAMNVGGAGDNFTNTCFTENAFLSINQGGPPYTGSFDPAGDLNSINNGQDPNGSWSLVIYDTYAFADAGFLYSWSLTFTDEVIDPEEDPYAFGESNLPLVYIDTYGAGIPDEPGTAAYLQVIDNGQGAMNSVLDPFTYEGHIDIETRGQSTQSFPKKSYGFEMKDAFGIDIDTSFVGLPADEDWILYAPYSEKSLLQNFLAMSLGRDMGGYHSRTRYCEVILNGVYDGIYLVMERIKQHPDRVDIANLNTWENSGDDLTGGYIWRIDWGGETGWYSEFPTPVNPDAYPYYQFVYPDPATVTSQQQEYLQAYVDSFEYALSSTNFSYGGKRYDELIDLGSFVDNFIMNELSKNVDAYRLSSYYYKDKASNGGKLRAGPLWDFNLSFGNADYCDGWHPEGWMYEYCGNSGPFWWPRFMQDTVFTNALKCRWDDLRGDILSFEAIEARIDSMALELGVAADRNFNRWPVLGQYVWPNPSPYAESFPEAVVQLKAWIFDRLEWLDANITGDPLCMPNLVNNGANTEDFEAGFPPNCWTIFSNDGDATGWNGAVPVAGYESPHSAFSPSFLPGQDNYLITPMLLPLEGEHLTWYIAGQAPATQEHYQVLLSTTGSGPADFTTVLWEETITGMDWQYRAADLSPWWGANIYLVFRHVNSDGLQLRLDQVRYPTWSQPGADCSVGVPEQVGEEWFFYPNPVANTAVIRVPRAEGEISWTDVTGRTVLRRQVDEQVEQWDASQLPSGAYQVRWCTTAGCSSRKVVVAR